MKGHNDKECKTGVAPPSPSEVTGGSGEKDLSGLLGRNGFQENLDI